MRARSPAPTAFGSNDPNRSGRSDQPEPVPPANQTKTHGSENKARIARNATPKFNYNDAPKWPWFKPRKAIDRTDHHHHPILQDIGPTSDHHQDSSNSNHFRRRNQGEPKPPPHPLDSPSDSQIVPRATMNRATGTRMIDHKPTTLPAIILPDCVLLPHCGLPLHIFEPRYRTMIRDALQSHRMMCVATELADDHYQTEPEGAQSAEPIGTAGVIRACVGQADGSSNVMLQGIGRVHFDHWHLTDDTPYPVADVSWVASESISPKRAEELRHEIMSVLGDRFCPDDADCQKMLKHLETVTDHGEVADLVAYHILGDDTDLMRRVLESPDHSDRLELVCNKLHSFH